MSKFVKRIGKKTIKFQVSVHIDKVSVNIKFPCQLFVIWKRGPRSIETQHVDMDLTTGSATFNEDLQLSATLFQDIKTKKYQEKKSSFTIVIVTPKGNKVAGACDIDVSSYPNQGIQEKKEVLGLKKSPDPNAKIHFTIQVILLSEVDNMSMMSDIVEQDSEEEAGSLEMSQFETDTTKNGSSKSNKSNMENVLSSLSTKTQIQEEVKQSQLRKQDDDSPKLAGLNQPSNQPYNPRKMTAEKAEPQPAGGKPGFKQLFEKGQKENTPETSNRVNPKTTQGGGSRGVSQEANRGYEREVESKPSANDSGSLREVDDLREELARKQTECGKLRKALENLKLENEELRSEGKAYESSSDEVIELRQRISDKNNEISELNGRVDELQRTIEDLRQNIYKLNKEKAQENRGVAQEIDKLKEQNKGSEKEKERLQQENQGLVSKISKLETDLKNLKSDYNMLRRENDNNLELYHSTQTKVDEMASSSQSSDLEVKKYKDKIGGLEQEIARLREQLKIVQSERDDFQKKGMDLTNIAKEKIRVAEEENTKLKERIQDLEKTYKEQLTKTENSVLDLKKQLKDAESKKEEALSKQTQLAIELQNLKINFERVNSELEYKNENYSSKSKDMESMKEGAEKEITKLREKLATVESQYKTEEIEYKQKVEDLRSKMEKFKASFEEVSAENEKLQSTLKEKEHNSSMQAASTGSEFENVKKSLESKILVLSEDVNLRTAAVSNLKKENKELAEQVQTLKQQNGVLEEKLKEESSRVNSQMSEMQEKIRLTETNSRPVNRELKEENDRLKKELSMLQKNTKAAQDVEKEVGLLSIENETLKKQVKELTSQVSNSKQSASDQNARNNEELKKKVKDLTRTLKKIEEDYDEAKNKLTISAKKNEEDDELLLKLNNKVTSLQEQISIMENEVVRTKQKIGEIMNVLMDSADVDIVDRVNNVIYENQG